MGALLKFILLALVVVWLLYSPAMRGLLGGKLPGQKGKAPGRSSKQPKQPSSPRRPDTIVPCARCGVHLPVSEAMLDIGGRAYCSDAHRLAGPGA